MGKKSYYYSLCNQYKVEPRKETRQNTKEQPTLGDELTPSKTQFSAFATQSSLLSKICSFINGFEDTDKVHTLLHGCQERTIASQDFDGLYLQNICV